MRQRLLVLLLLPTAAIMLGLGMLGFVYTRTQLLDQWRATALLALERDAHGIDMRLDQPAQAVATLNRAAGELPLDKGKWEDLLGKEPGVRSVDMVLTPEAQDEAAPALMAAEGRGMGRTGGMGRPYTTGTRPGAMGRGMRFHRLRMARVTNPTYDAQLGGETVRQIYELEDQDGKVMGRLELWLAFRDLLDGLGRAGWWQDEVGFLIDAHGHILARAGGAPAQALTLEQVGWPVLQRVREAMDRQPDGAVLGPGFPPNRVAGFQRLSEAPWTLVLVSPGEKVLRPVYTLLRAFAVVGTLITLFVLTLILGITRHVSRAVGKMSHAAARVARGDYRPVEEPRGRDELSRLARDFNRMVADLKEREFIRDTFGRYVDKEVAHQLMSGPQAQALGGSRRTVAVMMTDIRGFTPLCERLSPEETISLVNRYLSELIEVIQAWRGIIVDFVGDAVLAFFDSSGSSPEEAARRAACCALEVARAAESLNREMEREGLPRLETGVGLHAGAVVVGNIGSRARAKYGIMGAAVNLTQRVQSQAEGGQVVATAALAELAGPGLELGPERAVRLKGVPGDTILHEVTAMTPCMRPQAGPEGGATGGEA